MKRVVFTLLKQEDIKSNEEGKREIESLRVYFKDIDCSMQVTKYSKER